MLVKIYGTCFLTSYSRTAIIEALQDALLRDSWSYAINCLGTLSHTKAKGAYIEIESDSICLFGHTFSLDHFLKLDSDFDPWLIKYNHPSHTTEGKFYVVTEYKNMCTCTCDGYFWRGYCKHIGEV